MDDATWSTATGLIDGLDATLRLTDNGLTLRHLHDPDTVRDLPIEQIAAVRQQTGLFTGFLTIEIGDETMTVSKVRRSEIEPFVAALRARLPEHPVRPPDPKTSPTGASDSPLAELERLGRLRESGVLTAEEFETAKATLLGRL